MNQDAIREEVATHRVYSLAMIAIIASLIGWVYTTDISVYKLIPALVTIISLAFALYRQVKIIFSLISEMKNANID